MNVANVNSRTQFSQFSNPWSTQSYLAKTMCEHRLQIFQARAGSSDTRYNYNPLHNLSIHYLTYGVDVEVSADSQQSCYLIILPSEGELQCFSDKHAYMATPGSAVIISPGQSWRVQVPAGSRQCVLSIRKDAIEQQVIRLLGQTLKTPLQFDANMPATEGKTGSWWRNFHHLAMELHHRDSLFDHPKALESAEQLLLSTLLQVQNNSLYKTSLSLESVDIPAHVLRAEAFIRDNACRPIEIDEIIGAARVPKRTLYKGFERARQNTPLAYLRQVRMEGAREELLSGQSPSVTNTAMTWGFNHLGRFSAEYRKRYGESPSATLRLAAEGQSRKQLL